MRFARVADAVAVMVQRAPSRWSGAVSATARAATSVRQRAEVRDCPILSPPSHPRRVRSEPAAGNDATRGHERLGSPVSRRVPCFRAGSKAFSAQAAATLLYRQISQP